MTDQPDPPVLVSMVRADANDWCPECRNGKGDWAGPVWLVTWRVGGTEFSEYRCGAHGGRDE